MADVVVWNGNPFSVYAQAEQVYVDGARVYDRNDPSRQPKSDFMLGPGRRRREVCDERAAMLDDARRRAARSRLSRHRRIAQDLLIRNATVHTATARGTLQNADVLVRDGRISAVGSGPGRRQRAGRRRAAARR